MSYQDDPDSIGEFVKEYQEKVRQNEMIEKCVPNDNVSHPSHYTQGGIECIEAIKASMNGVQYQGYLKGNCMKYIWRWRIKGGVEDLKKARVYLDWLIGTIEGANDVR